MYRPPHEQEVEPGDVRDSEVETAKGARGHSSLRDKADQEVSIRTSGGDLSIDGKPLSTVVVFENTKNRNEDRWGLIQLDLRKTSDETLAPIIVGKYLVSGRPANLLTDNQTRLSVVRALIEGTTTDNQPTTGGILTTRELGDAAGISKQAVGRTVKPRIDGGLVTLDDSGMTHRYAVTEAGRAQATTTDNQPTTTETTNYQPTTNHRHLIGAGVVDSGDQTRRTTLEELREVTAQEDADEVVEEGGAVILEYAELFARGRA